MQDMFMMSKFKEHTSVLKLIKDTFKCYFSHCVTECFICVIYDSITLHYLEVHQCFNIPSGGLLIII
jgi:hypothetical protein